MLKIAYYKMLLEHGLFMLLVFLFTFAVLAIPTHNLQYFDEYDENKVLTSKGQEAVHTLESLLQETIAGADNLALFTIQTKGEGDYSLITEHVLLQHPFISAIAIMPEMGENFIYYSKHNIFGDQSDFGLPESIGRNINIAKNERKTFVTEPIELSRNDWRSMVYKPVFFEKKFWGVVVFSIDVAEELQSEVMANILGDDLMMTVSYINPNSDEAATVIFNNINNDVQQDKVFSLNMLGGKWDVKIANKSQSSRYTISYAITAILSFIVSFLCLKFYLITHELQLINHIRRREANIQCYGRLVPNHPCRMDSGNPCRNDGLKAP